MEEAFVICGMLKEACIEDFLIFVNYSTNIDSKIWSPLSPPFAPPLDHTRISYQSG